MGKDQIDVEAAVRSVLAEMSGLVTEKSQPLGGDFIKLIREINILSLNVKYFGYELARSLAAALPVREDVAPRHVGLKSKPSTQADLESDWIACWMGRLKTPVVFHRKLWELGYVLQAIYEHGHMQSGRRGLGFGCGVEPLPSFLASLGIDVTVTDLAPEASRDLGWIQTNEFASSLDAVYQSHLVDRPTFDRHVSLRYVDMNAIPDDLAGYDFCWSICALEHLGSIRKGLEFIENSLKTLRPGGLAVHTTEFNFLNDEKTIDDWPTVLYQKKHFSELAEQLRAQGHTVAELDFDVGSKPLDRFIDVPPWTHDMTPYMAGVWGHDSRHIKLSVDGFAATCFGLIITRAG